MKTQIIKVGDQLALMLPEDIVTQLEMKDGQELHLRPFPDGSLRIDTGASLHGEAMRIVDKAMVEYAETLKTLAKT